MKRFFFIGLIGFYFLFSVGVNVLVHTCGEFRTFDLMPVAAKDPCECSDAMGDDPCCTLSLQAFHIDDDQGPAPRVVTAPATGVCALLPIEDHGVSVEMAARPVSIASSPPQQIPPTILGCALLI